MTRLLIATTNPHKLREIEALLADAPVEIVSLAALPALPEPVETGSTFAENARLKARYYDRSAQALRHTSESGPTESGAAQSRPARSGPAESGPAESGPCDRGASECDASDRGASDRGASDRGAGLQPCVLSVAEDSGLVVDALDGEPGLRSARFLRADATYPERFAEIFRRLDSRPQRPRTARFVCTVAVVANGSVVFETTGVVEGEIAREPRGTAGFGYDPIFYYPPYRCTLAEVSEASKLRVAHRGQAFRALAQWLGVRSGSDRGQSHDAIRLNQLTRSDSKP